MTDYRIDDTDRTIMACLEEDGRRNFSEIADEVGVTPPTVRARFDDLVDAGLLSITTDISRQTETVTISTQSLRRLLRHSGTVHADPSSPWYEADEKAVNEANEALEDAHDG